MEIIDLLKSHVQEIKACFGVKRIGLFGSFARGEQKESSDIDVLVEFEKPTFRNFMDLSFYLEDSSADRWILSSPSSLPQSRNFKLFNRSLFYVKRWSL